MLAADDLGVAFCEVFKFDAKCQKLIKVTVEKQSESFIKISEEEFYPHEATIKGGPL